MDSNPFILYNFMRANKDSIELFHILTQFPTHNVNVKEENLQLAIYFILWIGTNSLGDFFLVLLWDADASWVFILLLFL